MNQRIVSAIALLSALVAGPALSVHPRESGDPRTLVGLSGCTGNESGSPLERGCTETPIIDTQDLQKLLKAGPVLLLDVARAPRRPENLAPGAPWLPLPHEDIPGSVWIPDVGDDPITSAAAAFLRDQMIQRTGDDRGRPIVVYCHEHCTLSRNAARRITGFGYRHVLWYAGGIEAWRAAGLPISESRPMMTPSE